MCSVQLQYDSATWATAAKLLPALASSRFSLLKIVQWQTKVASLFVLSSHIFVGLFDSSFTQPTCSSWVRRQEEKSPPKVANGDTLYPSSLRKETLRHMYQNVSDMLCLSARWMRLERKNNELIWSAASSQGRKSSHAHKNRRQAFSLGGSHTMAYCLFIQKGGYLLQVVKSTLIRSDSTIHIITFF